MIIWINDEAVNLVEEKSPHSCRKRHLHILGGSNEVFQPFLSLFEFLKYIWIVRTVRFLFRPFCPGPLYFDHLLESVSEGLPGLSFGDGLRHLCKFLLYLQKFIRRVAVYVVENIICQIA